MKSSTQPSLTTTSFHFLERYEHCGIMWSWSYPSIEAEEKQVFEKKYQFFMKSSEINKIPYYRFNSKWFYFKNCVKDEAGTIPGIEAIILVICSKDFHPRKYEGLCDIFTKSYLQHRQFVKVLELYFDLTCTDQCALEDGKIKYKFADYLKLSPFPKFDLKSIINKFGVETILLYAALLRKRRIVIYHYDIGTSVQYTLSVPYFLPNSDIWGSIFPWVDLNEEELSQFKDTAFHVIGCNDAAIESCSDIYDVFVNVPAGEIFVASHSKESMMMSKFHKELAMFIVKISENSELSQLDMAHEIHKKCEDLAWYSPHTIDLATEKSHEEQVVR